MIILDRARTATAKQAERSHGEDERKRSPYQPTNQTRTCHEPLPVKRDAPKKEVVLTINDRANR